MFIIKYKKIFLGISAVLIVASIVSLIVFGLKVGIDFKGGSLVEVAYIDQMPALNDIQTEVDALGFGSSVIQRVGEEGLYIKTRYLSEEEKDALVETLSLGDKYEVEAKSFTSIGPSVGKELKTKSVTSLIIVAFALIIFIAYAFRRVSKEVSSWKYGFIAIAALIHDVILTTGAFILISRISGAEADTLFVVALLTVLGLSVNDTIVVFDRIRENLTHKISGDFKTVVGKSLEQTIVRSINTSLSTIIVLLALFFVGPASTKIFALTLACGMFFGTYSSIFVASPLLVVVESARKRE